MPRTRHPLTIALCAAAFLAAAGLTDRTLTQPAWAADRKLHEPTAQDALTPAELAGLEALSNSFRKLARLVRPGVVLITVAASQSTEADPDMVERLREAFGDKLSEEQLQELARRIPPASGSGIIMDSQGRILTNSHVVSKRQEIEVRLDDKRTYAAKLVGVDTKTDVAVIQIEAPELRPLTFANSDQVEVGDWVLAVGAPFGLTQTVTHGIISATGRAQVPGLSKIYYQNFIQTDAAINPGNSGGPLLNMRGEVLGINTAIATDDDRNAGVAFAIPSNMALKVARTLIEKGVVTRGWLGISFFPGAITSIEVEILGLPHDRGVLVESILAKSPAQKAGLQVDDYIIALNGQELSGAEQFTNVVGDFEPDQELKLQVIRDGQPREVSLQLAQQPDDPLDRSLSADATDGRTVQRLGVAGRALRPRKLSVYEADDRGILVMEVQPDGPCAKAVEPGEVITAVNDKKVRNLAEVEAALATVESGTKPGQIRIDILQKDGDQRLEKITPR